MAPWCVFSILSNNSPTLKVLVVHLDLRSNCTFDKSYFWRFDFLKIITFLAIITFCKSNFWQLILMTNCIFDSFYFWKIIFSANCFLDESYFWQIVLQPKCSPLSFFSSQFEKPLRKINWTEDNCFYSSFRLTSDAGKRENIKFGRFSFNLFVLLCVGSTFEAKRIKRSPVDQAVMGLNPYQVKRLNSCPNHSIYL